MKKRIILFLFFGGLLLFLGKSQAYSAETCGLPMDWCKQEIGDPYTTCCTSGGGCPVSSVCGDLNQWDWCYASDCCGVLDPQLCDYPYGNYVCYYDWRYGYSYIRCGARDSCLGGPYLYAGQCGSSGCVKGGLYKTCCEKVGGNFTGNLGGSCLNGNFSGVCSGGSEPVICGVSSSVCASVGGYACTTAACGQSACQAVAVSPTPTPGVTPGTTPTPTQPPPAGSCPDYASWCTNSSNCTNNGCTVYNTPYGACATSGDICCGCPGVSSSRIGVNIRGTSHEVGSQVTIEVYQEPAKSGDSACYYDGIDVKVNNPGGTLLPPDFTVCRATGFRSGASNSCSWKPSGAGSGRCRTCIWDTNNIQAAPDGRAKDFPIRQYPTEPSGYYVAGVYYGGHSDPGCSDSPGSASDNTTLWGNSDIWVDPREDYCPEGTVKQEVNISAHVDTAFNSLRGWTTLYGQPSIMNRYSNCCFRSRGNCDPWGHCGDIQPYNGTNFVTYKEQCGVSPYAIRTRIPILEENIGKEYIASVMGTGVKAAHPDDSSDGASRPNMRLVSGDLTTKDYQFSGDCTWEEGAYKMVARDSWLDIYLISKTVRRTYTVDPPQAAFDNLRLYYCVPPVPPPTCRISGGLTASVGEEAQFCVTAENAGDGSEIWYAPLGSNLSLGSSWTNIRPKTVGDGCGTVTFSQSGTYHVACNAYGEGGACSGNPGCPWGTHPYPGFTCSGWTDCTSNDSMVVTVTAPNAWYQTQGGNVYGQVVSSTIPSMVTNRYFSLSSSWTESGLVSSSSKEPESADFNNAQVSQTDSSWRAQGNLSTIANRYTYQYFTSLLDINEANEAVAFREEEILANPGSLGESIIVYSGDNMTIGNPYWVVNNQKIIALVDGDLIINEPISIVGSGFLALIVNGNLTIDVGTSPESVSPLLQGVYIVDGAIIIPEREAEPKFVGEGIFFARGGFSLEKDLNDANVSYPAELFIFNPRYLFAAPRILRYAPQFWQELAP